MVNLIGSPIRHPQLKRVKGAMAKLILDFRRPHDTLILPGGSARGNLEYLVPAPYPATASFRKTNPPKADFRWRVESSVSRLRFSGEGTHCGPRRRGKSKAQRLKPIQQRRDGRYQPRPLGVQQQSQGAREPDFQGLGDAPRHAVVKHHDGITALESQGDDLCLTGSQIRYQRQDRRTGRRSDCNPIQGAKIRQVEALGPPRVQLVDDGGRDDHPPNQSRKNVQHLQLVKVLQR